MVDVGWRLPSGEFLTPDNYTLDVHVTGVGKALVADNTMKAIILLTINALSYQHAGMYSCEIQDITTPGAEWITEEVHLQLRGNNWCLPS